MDAQFYVTVFDVFLDVLTSVHWYQQTPLLSELSRIQIVLLKIIRILAGLVPFSQAGDGAKRIHTNTIYKFAIQKQ